ncbi:MAG: carotenoid oxygenase family protein [Oceanicoccus sp.]
MNAKLNDMVQNKPLLPDDNPILQGNFGPVSEELTLHPLEVVGTLPDALNGTLLRNGPNPVDPQPNHHWFVGDAMLHAIKLSKGKALEYRNRWVRTTALEEKTGLKAAPVTGTELMVQGSGAVNVVQHGGYILALPEVGLPYQVNLNLETERQFDYEGKLASSMTAHPKIDGKTGEMLFFGYDLVEPFLRYHSVSADGKLTKTIEIDLPAGVMMHDFGVTATRVVFMDLPVVCNFDLMEDGYPMPFQWDDNHQSRLGVMDRSATSDTVKWIDIDPCYVFHPLNSYDDGDNIVMDVVKYNKVFTSVSDAKYAKGAQLERWVIDVDAGTVSNRVLSDKDQEFPRIDPRLECHPHRYGYTLEAGGAHGFGGLYKHDLAEGSTQYHSVGENYAAGEPVFIPTGKAEDCGYILTVVYDVAAKTSEVRVIDAQDFSGDPVAIIKLNARVPFGFHGNFVAEKV